MSSDGRPLYDTTIFVLNLGLDRLEYVAGLQTLFWCRLPIELVNRVAEALRDLLFEALQWSQMNTVLPNLRKAAMICRYWRRLFSPLLWRRYTTLHTTIQIHLLEEIISSSIFIRPHNYFEHLRLHPSSDIAQDSFFSAWQSLSRRLHHVTSLQIAGPSSGILKSFPIRLRPCPRPLLHLNTLELSSVIFPSFSALFRSIGALPSLEQLHMLRVQWKGACDPSVPPSSTALFGRITAASAIDCTDDGWPIIWIFTTLSARYVRSRHTLEDVKEARTRSVCADIYAIVQAVNWTCDRPAGLQLKCAGLALEGNKLSSISCMPYD